MSIQFRPATREDLPHIVRLLADDVLGSQRESYETPLPACYYEAFETVTNDRNCMLIIAENDSGIIGTMQLNFIHGISHKGASRAQIEAVHIDERYRGQGTGKKMIQWAIKHAKQHGCRFVQLTSNKTRLDAHRFYKQLGFKATHEGFKLELLE